MSQQKVSVVVTVDEKYVQHLAVMLHSLICHTSVPVDVFILSPGLSDFSLKKLNEWTDSHSLIKLVYLEVNNIEKFSSLYVSGHLSSVCFFRFALAEILPSSLEKVIYLDPDMVVLGDIYSLWQEDLEGYPLGAVAMPFYKYTRIGLREGSPYFNSGVMVIDLNQWRESTFGESLFLKGYELGEKIFGDQDVLNVIFSNKWKKLPLTWNKTESFYLNPKELAYSNEEISNSSNGGIIHFTGSCKPWHFACRHPKRHLYWEYLRQTPWRQARAEDISLYTFCVKLLPFRLKNYLIRVIDRLA